MPINGHSRKGSLLVGGEGIDIKKGEYILCIGWIVDGWTEAGDQRAMIKKKGEGRVSPYPFSSFTRRCPSRTA